MALEPPAGPQLPWSSIIRHWSMVPSRFHTNSYIKLNGDEIPSIFMMSLGGQIFLGDTKKQLVHGHLKSIYRQG